MTPRDSDKDRLRKQLGIPPKRTIPVPELPDQGDDEFVEPIPDDESDDPQGAGRIGTAKPLVSITFRFKNKNTKSFAYAHLYSVDLDLSGEIVLTFSGHTVRLTGEKLQKLATRIEDHKHRYVLEEDPMQAAAVPGREWVVTGMKIDEIKDGK